MPSTSMFSFPYDFNGDFPLNDWVPALSLVNGALPKEAIEAAFHSRANNRGLFAATQFQSRSPPA